MKICNIGYIEDITYSHVRSPVETAGIKICDGAPRFGMRGLGITETVEQAQFQEAKYVIVPPTMKYDEAAYYVNDKIALAYELEDESLLGKVLDDYYTSVIILGKNIDRNNILRKIYSRGVCYKEIWALRLRGNIRDELMLLSQYSFISLVLTEDVAKLAYSQTYFSPKGLKTELDMDYTYNLTLPQKCDIITAYNKYCLTCWSNGLDPKYFDEFIGGKGE